ncbi:MAG: PAS domain S-box protein [Magnetospirillum sp.]|nr:PAS domain S-box protein [Magnetospirillum sp.]
MDQPFAPGDLPLVPARLTPILSDLGLVTFRREMSAGGEIRYTHFSANVAEVFGDAAAAGSVTSRGALNAAHWADRDVHLGAILASAAVLGRCTEEFRIVTTSGETRWLQGASLPERQPDGRIVWEGAWTDITRWMRAERQFQTVMDHAEDLIVTVDAEVGIDWMNVAAERAFDLESSDMRGRCLSALFPDSRAQCSEGRAAACIHDDLTFCFPRGSCEVMARRRDGRGFPVEMTVSEVRADGRLSLIVIGRDITRRKATEAMLEESEERFRLAFAAASLGIVVVSLDGIIQHCNPAFETMCGAAGRSLKGGDFFAYVDRSLLPAAPVPGEAFSIVYAPRLPDGGERHWRITGTQFSASGDAEAHSLLFHIDDISEMTRATAERHQLELALQDGQKLEALGRLAGGIAHELNNMLGPILMAAEMLQRSAKLDERNAERCLRIIEAAKHGRDIVRNVLAYCRKESTSLGVIDVVPAVRQFASLAASALPPTVHVHVEIAPEAALVVGDGGQIAQILLNLANNASDAMCGHGVLTLAVEVVEAGALVPPARQLTRPQATCAAVNPFADLNHGLAHVVLTLSDTGSGMGQDTMARIFDPFYTTKPVGQGTGLGLSVVQGIVKGMGGAITVASAPGDGTTFRIALPVAEG